MIAARLTENAMSTNEIDVNLRNGDAILFDGRVLMTDVQKSGNLEVLSSISIELDALRLGPLNSTRVCKITLRTEFTRYRAPD